ncbi:hypothetical protein CRUP_022927 [Coryphaenoides rupestris]|nr:hypothetical protein CRUP_022927 [Coryphaenoides rupestris]
MAVRPARGRPDAPLGTDALTSPRRCLCDLRAPRRVKGPASSPDISRAEPSRAEPGRGGGRSDRALGGLASPNMK